MSTLPTTFRSTPALRAIGEELLAGLDQAKIIAAVRNTTIKLNEWEWAQVGDMIYSVIEKFAARDTQWLELSALEYRFEVNGESGVYDMIGTFSPEAPEHLRGRRFVRDWKSARSALDANWVARYTNSWQWRIYLYNSGAEVFVYTGVSLNGDTREFYLERPANLVEQVKTLMTGMNLMATPLIETGLKVYPMHQPGSCYAYGRPCPFRDDCSSYSMSKEALEPWNWSPSSIDHFLLCPERFRRERLLRQAEAASADGGTAADIGTAFHAGIAEVYRQLWGFGETETPAATSNQ